MHALPKDTVMCQPIPVVLHCKLILTSRTVQNLKDIVLSPLAEVTAQEVTWLKHVLNFQLFSVRGLGVIAGGATLLVGSPLAGSSPLLSLPILDCSQPFFYVVP